MEDSVRLDGTTRPKIDVKTGPFVVLVVGFSLAAVLRLWCLDTPLLDADESHWFSWAMHPRTLLQTTMLNEYPRPDLFFPLISRPFITLFGYREIGVRFVPAVSGLLFGLLPGLFLLGTFRNRWIWTLAAIVSWFIPVSVWGSRQGIPDMMAVFLVCLSLVGITGVWNNRLVRLMWPGFLAVGALSKGTTVMLLPAILGIIVTHPEMKNRLRKVILTICAYMPLLIITMVLKYTGERIDFLDTHRHLFGLGLARIPYMLKLTFYGLGLWVIPAIFGLALSFSDSSMQRYRCYAWLLTPAVFFPFYRVTLKEIVFLLPGIVVFTSIGLVWFLRKSRRPAAAAVLTIVIALLNLGLTHVSAGKAIPIFPDPRLISSAKTRDLLENRLPKNASFIFCSSKYCEPMFYQLNARKRNVAFARNPIAACRLATPDSVMLFRIPYDGKSVRDDAWHPLVVERRLPPGSQFTLLFFRPEIFMPRAVSETEGQ